MRRQSCFRPRFQYKRLHMMYQQKWINLFQVTDRQYIFYFKIAYAFIGCTFYVRYCTCGHKTSFCFLLKTYLILVIKMNKNYFNSGTSIASNDVFSIACILVSFTSETPIASLLFSSSPTMLAFPSTIKK